MGVTGNRKSATEYDDGMKRAFALNIGNDDYGDTQLGFAYKSAAKNGMKVFLSFDFNWWDVNKASAVGAKIKQYANLTAQLKVDKKVFVSSFSGDGVDVETVRSAAGQDIFFAPNFHPDKSDFGALDGAFNWMAWPSNGENKAPTAGKNVSVSDGDNAYLKALGKKDYIARKFYPGFLSDFSPFLCGPDVDDCSGFAVVLDALWRRSLLQQELGLPIRLAVV